MNKILSIFLINILYLVLSISPIVAFDQSTQISFVNPVRGLESWSLDRQKPLDLPILQYQLSTPSAFPITWLLRYDAVSDATISAYFDQLITQDKTQKLGAFLEITPQLTKIADVVYPSGEYISAPNRIFLTGYSQADRIKLIDAYMKSFFAKFGFYPNTVGAWYIDSYSLEYLQRHYSVVAAVLCDEQYSTDNYRLWGSYLAAPYFPSKKNALIPAGNPSQKIDLAVVKWAVRDPYNFYDMPSASAYSVQVNDYTGVGQNTDYFGSLLSIYQNREFNEFGQIVIGLENDYQVPNFISEVKRQYKFLSQNQKKYDLKFVQLSEFGEWFKRFFPVSSPAYFFKAKDVSTNQKSGEIFWFQNPKYRIGLKVDNGLTTIIDFRVYSAKEAEPYLYTPNHERILYAETPAIIDSRKFPESGLSIPVDISNFSTSKHFQELILSNGDQKLIFQPDRIIFDRISAPEINSKDLRISKSKEVVTWTPRAQVPFSSSTSPLIICLILSIFIYLAKKLHLPLHLCLIGLSFSLVSLFTVFKSGSVYDYGLGLWGPNGHDAIFHLSLAESFSHNPFSLKNPQLSGTSLQNYHFAFDYFIGITSRLTHISTLDLYFKYMPLLFAVLIVILVIKLLKNWQWSDKSIIISLFGIFLFGSFGFLFKLFSEGQIFSGESIFWANQSVSIFLNPPFAMSIVGLLVFLNLLPTQNWLLLSFVGGLLAQTKIYAFILLCIGLLIVRKWRLLIGVATVGVAILLPFMGKGVGFPFVVSPLWFARSLFQAYDRLPWPQLAQAWQVYESLGVFHKLVAVNLLAFTVFVVGNLGVRIFGLFSIVRSKAANIPQSIVYTIIFSGIFIPTIFVQKINPWNTIQFLYYSLFFLSFFTAQFIDSLVFKNKKIKMAILFVFIVFSLFTTIGTLRDYAPYLSASRVSFAELRALDFLQRQPRGTVISPIFNLVDAKVIPAPKSLYGYVSTAYISALSRQPEYLSDTINLDITGYNYSQEYKNIKRLYQTRDPIWVKEFLKDNKISYVYETPLGRLGIRHEEACLTRIFDSGEIYIYKYSCL